MECNEASQSEPGCDDTVIIVILMCLLIMAYGVRLIWKRRQQDCN